MMLEIELLMVGVTDEAVDAAEAEAPEIVVDNV